MKRIFKALLIASCLIFFAASVFQAVAQGSEFGLAVKEFTLDNGMLFLVVERPVSPQVACRLAIRAGAALEERGKTGIAHMLEHMMFKGTKNFGTLDYKRDQELQEKIEAAYQVIKAELVKRHPDRDLIARKKAEMARLREEVLKIYVPQAFSSQLGKNGAVNVNAFTSMDQTQYLASLPSDMLEQWFSIISEQLFEPAWREFYVEKEVVQREWAYRYINNPNGAAWLDLDALAYTAHPYRNPVIGWKSDMEMFSTRDATEFHREYYNPSNAVCVLVGDVRVEEVRRLAKIYFERYPAGRRAPEIVTREPVQEGPRESLRYLKGARTPLVRIGFHAPPMGEKDFYALDVLSMVLSYGHSSRINQNIINRGLADRAWATNLDTRYGGLFVLGGSPNEPGELVRDGVSEAQKRRIYLKVSRELEEMLLKEVEGLKERPVSRKELERVIKMNQRALIEKLRDNEGLAGTLATLEIQKEWRYLMSYLDRLREITPREIMDAAEKYLTRERKNTVFIMPGGRAGRPPIKYEEMRTISGKAALQLAKPKSFENHSIYPTPPGWKHPLSFERHPEKIIYPRAETASIGGSKLFYLPDRELPLIDLTILVKAGKVDLPPSKAGLAGILSGSIIRGGTERYGPAVLAVLLDEKAIDLSVSIGEEMSFINLSVMKEDWEKGLEILEEVLRRPRFDALVLDAVKKQALSALKRQSEDAQAVSMREWRIWHFKDHPYGRDPLKGVETIPRIRREDLTGFLKTYFVPGNMVLCLAGDIEKEKAIEDLERFLGGFEKKEVPVRDLAEPGETPPVIALIHKPGQVQSQVTMGLPGIKRTNPDYWKMDLLVRIFGGKDSLLYTRLRDDLGLVYSAGFFQSYKWKAGFLAGYVGCRADKTAESVRETVKIMDSLRREVPERELEQKRLDSLNSFVFNVDTPAELVEVYGRYYMRNEPLDTLERIQDSFIGATREELESLARKFLDPKKLQVFVVADKTIETAPGESLEEDLVALAQELGLPYREMPLR
ncbi:MAG: insulinase family protein [Deltaproteobacteria bacterium]|nr:insulinase family protein [Deltaproteobacteria bacterium]